MQNFKHISFMKKLLLMIATVALLASCNGSGSTSNSASGEQTDSVATQEAPAKEEVVKGPVTIENPSWTVDVPEGWEVVSNAPGSSQKNSSYLRIKPIERPEGAVGLLAVVIKSYPYKTNTVEQEQETFVKAFKVIRVASSPTCVPLSSPKAISLSRCRAMS